MERELLKAKETISRLEKEKLATVDRFRPATDQDVVNLFKQVQNKAKTLSNFLAKQMVSDLKESEWVAGMMKLTWDVAYSPEIYGIDPKKNTHFRKQLWRLFIWNWLNDTIIGGPFSSYGGPEITQSLSRHVITLCSKIQKIWDSVILVSQRRLA